VAHSPRLVGQRADDLATSALSCGVRLVRVVDLDRDGKVLNILSHR
jgi:hypothetical protein